jgi:hypothetical protein
MNYSKPYFQATLPFVSRKEAISQREKRDAIRARNARLMSRRYPTELQCQRAIDRSPDWAELLATETMDLCF